MKRFGMLCALLAGALLAGQAQAQAPGQTYFGVGYGAVWTDGASPYGNTIDDDTAAGAKIYGGKMWSHFGMEVGLYGLGKYDVNFGGAKIAESSAAAIAVSGVLAVPITTAYSFHAKLGLAFTQYEIECEGACVPASPTLVNTKRRGTSGLLGVGFGAKMGQNVAVRVDWEHFGSLHQATGSFEYKDSYDMFSVSLQFAF